MVGEWLTTTDHKRIGRLFISVSLTALLGLVVVAALLGIERIDAEAAMLDIDSLPQLFSLYRIGLTFVVLVPLLLGVAIAVVRCSSAPVPWRSPVGCRRLLDVARRRGAGRHLDRRQRWPGGGDTGFVALFLVGHIMVLSSGLSLPRARSRPASSPLVRRA